MEYRNPEIAKVAKQLAAKFDRLEDKRTILKAPELTALYDRLKTLPAGKARADFGKEVNKLKNHFERLARDAQLTIHDSRSPIDVTAPFDTNLEPDQRPGLLPADNSSQHPLTTELQVVLDIFGRMGFTAVESREIDDDYHVFGSLNFPIDHPARDDYDTFITEDGLIAPPHTSIMQNRLAAYSETKT
jgi:phenylalanyl-tRNA synthetase alpha chain